jgi:beta-1,4-mannosyltransferase
MTAMSEIYPIYSGVPMPNLRTDRPALLVSSTSWTPDEDFSILLEALGLYEKRTTQLATSQPTSHGQLPKLLVIVTGKGPLREKYMEEVGNLQKSWKWVRCISLWLEAEDYPTLLGWLMAFLYPFIAYLFNYHRIGRSGCLLAFEQFRA